MYICIYIYIYIYVYIYTYIYVFVRVLLRIAGTGSWGMGGNALPIDHGPLSDGLRTYSVARAVAAGVPANLARCAAVYFRVLPCAALCYRCVAVY